MARSGSSSLNRKVLNSSNAEVKHDECVGSKHSVESFLADISNKLSCDYLQSNGIACSIDLNHVAVSDENILVANVGNTDESESDAELRVLCGKSLNYDALEPEMETELDSDSVNYCLQNSSRDKDG